VRTLFIDDRRENVETARAEGWQALQFRDGRGLRSDLAGLGIAV
jgi:2-haloacid dehalogenase